MKKMKQQRRSGKVIAVRIVTALATTGIIGIGAVAAPAQADTGWNRHILTTPTNHP